jgi:hypothetical protein
MRFRTAVLITVALLTGLTVLEARPKDKGKKAWSEPFDQWSREQVTELLRNSPWAQAQNVAAVLGTQDAGQAGERDFFYVFTIRFFSALPIREGYVRLYQLMNGYDSKDGAEKQKFDAKFKRALDLDTSKSVIVALEFSTNDPQKSRDANNFLHTATKETFKQSAYLVSQRLGRVELEDYYPPSTDGTGAKFVFPRVVNGQPVVSPEDKNVRLDIYMPPVNQRIFVTFEVDKMAYGDKLSY